MLDEIEIAMAADEERPSGQILFYILCIMESFAHKSWTKPLKMFRKLQTLSTIDRHNIYTP